MREKKKKDIIMEKNLEIDRRAREREREPQRDRYKDKEHDREKRKYIQLTCYQHNILAPVYILY